MRPELLPVTEASELEAQADVDSPDEPLLPLIRYTQFEQVTEQIVRFSGSRTAYAQTYTLYITREESIRRNAVRNGRLESLIVHPYELIDPIYAAREISNGSALSRRMVALLSFLDGPYQGDLNNLPYRFVTFYIRPSYLLLFCIYC